MYFILGEDESDFKTLTVIIRRLLSDKSVKVGGERFHGSSDMLRRGARVLKEAAVLGPHRFILCMDADGLDPKPVRRMIDDRIVKPSRINRPCCLVVPVQEIEAWILADIEAVTHLFPSWRPKPIPHPESQRSPKEYLEKLSRDRKRRNRYDHAIHNVRVAEYLDLEKVKAKCPSFVPLWNFLTSK